MLALALALALSSADAVGEGGVAAIPGADLARPEFSEPLTLSQSKGEPAEGRVPGTATRSLSPGRLALDRTNAQDEYGWEGEGEEEDEDREPRLFLIAWGGQAFDLGSGDAGDGSAFGGEVSYSLGFGDLGLWGSGYKIRNGGQDWAPIMLLRLTNRFQTRRGLEAAFTFGAGAGRPDVDWRLWFQVALGLRLDLGPMFLAGELAFEQDQLLRLSAGLGVKL
ncbi:hypothetical protein [Anaeromyxobacter sp. Fw109-5]|uniref:hypothetical protein n=1 Tax=Anaeromyxobacter sp. (strain Fw109-5) TaxID=404589 RepID=UPI0000ED6F0C|nr:hypothetical protein [Anaeromyxobacter sp. Fw109-5]ABS28119.1 hypothetical protein Anae109_3941 [Anaeromyxobacter sp. Fw109-5]